jgi:hypothetical protein
MPSLGVFVSDGSALVRSRSNGVPSSQEGPTPGVPYFRGLPVVLPLDVTDKGVEAAD